jgi:hypothetical protein
MFRASVLPIAANDVNFAKLVQVYSVGREASQGMAAFMGPYLGPEGISN